tara:strand:- start:4670 stop:4915 length:246 start_codon:yes stop_codon:yes gene_type:complete
MNRQQRRALEQRIGKSKATSIEQQLNQFEKLPQQCSACANEFDKQNREMLQTWQVVVTGPNVRIFCPTCIQKTQEILNGSR